MVAKITSKGQLTVPKEVRERLGLAPGDRVDFVCHEDGRVELRPVRVTLDELMRILPKPRRRATLEQIERAIAEGHVRGGLGIHADPEGDA